MFTALALAAVLSTAPVQPGTLTLSPTVCATAGLWAESAGEAGYVCATSDPSQTAAIAAAAQAHPTPAHHAAPKRHHAAPKRHHARPAHHARPKHRARRR